MNGYAPTTLDGTTIQTSLLSALRMGLIWDNEEPWAGRLSPTAGQAMFMPQDINTMLAAGCFTSSYHMETAEEIREQTWDAIAWGAKGILFNFFGTDGTSDLGFCGNSFEDNVNSGFSDVPYGENVTAPPGGVAPGWNSASQYYLGNWVKRNGNFYVCNSPVGPPSTDPASDNQHWGTSFTYSYYTLPISPKTGYLIPPQTVASQTTPCFPDHLLLAMDFSQKLPTNANAYLWIPCFSDFTILNNGNPDINIGDPITSAKINDYLQGVQGINSFSATPPTSGYAHDNQTALKNYYSQFLPGNANCGNPSVSNWGATTGFSWVPAGAIPAVGGWVEASNPDDASGTATNWPSGNWVAADRDLDKAFTIHNPDCSYTTPAVPPRHSGVTPLYDWGEIPFAFPISQDPGFATYGAVRLDLTVDLPRFHRHCIS